MKLSAIASAILLVSGSFAWAWEGFDEDGNSVFVNQETLVRPGTYVDLDIVETGETTSAEVISIYEGDYGIVIEAQDPETGEFHYFEMQD